MLYAFLKPVVSLSLRLFFCRVKCDGLSNTDTGGPVLFLANHAAAFMDAFLIACCLRRKLHFFARGDAFKNGFAERLLGSLGIMPVYRQSEGLDKLHLNGHSHRQALSILRQGGAVLIFCEGASDTRKRLKPLKKGPFRLAADAAALLEVPPVIVPVGINYTSPASPGGEVFLQASAPIAAADFLEENSEAGRAKAATRLMRATEAALRRLVWHTEREEDFEVVNAVFETLPLHGSSLPFPETQQMLAAIHAGGAARQALLSELRQRIAALRSTPIKPHGRLVLWLGALPALAGYCLHWIPLRLAKAVMRRSVREEDFMAPVLLCCAILFLSLWYVLALLVVLLSAASAWWLLALPAAAACGVFFLKIYQPLLHRKRLADRAISRLEALQHA